MGFLWPTVKIVVATLVTLYGVVPVVLYCAPLIHVNFIFMNFVKWPFTNYTDPQTFGVSSSSRNFYLTEEDGVKLGIWQILPKAVTASTHEEFEMALSNVKRPIFVYNHGNSWSRAGAHRVKLYNILSEVGYHVIAYDYRGYGDSTGSPTELGMITDAMKIYEWTLSKAGSNPIFMWGHSLGTAISTAAVGRLCSNGECPFGLVLESPFNNLTEILKHHPLSNLFRLWPWYEWFLVNPPIRYGLVLNTDERIKEVKCPVLILHAKDDRIIPFHLAVKLRDVAKQAGVDVSFIDFDHPLNYGHKYICNAPELPDVIYEFVERAVANVPK